MLRIALAMIGGGEAWSNTLMFPCHPAPVPYALGSRGAGAWGGVYPPLAARQDIRPVSSASPHSKARISHYLVGNGVYQANYILRLIFIRCFLLLVRCFTM